MDSTEPYDIDCIGRTSALALRLPRGWLQFWVPSPADCVAQTFGSGGWSGALNAALASLDLESVGQLALPPSSVAEQLAALIALAAGGRLNDAPRTGRLEKLRRAIRDRLHEPDLVPQSLAQQFNISKRYLHQLFAAGGTTFGRELMALRLERARELLQDRRFAALPVSEIAARCGFEDPSHFSRRFRRRFGEAPRECRGAHPRGEADAG